MTITRRRCDRTKRGRISGGRRAAGVGVRDLYDRPTVVSRADGALSECGEERVLHSDDVVPGFALNLAEIRVDAVEEWNAP